MAGFALALPNKPRNPAALYGTRAQLMAASGEVEGCLALAACDARAATASYALRVTNQSAQPLRAQMVCAKRNGDRVRGYPLDVRVAPYSVSETLLPVRMDEVGPYDRAIVEVSGEGISFTLEAPAPPRRVHRAKWIGLALSIAAFTGVCAFGAGAATPRLDVLAAPARAFAGNAIDVPYAYGGWAVLQYALQTADGRQLTAGLLAAHSGTLHFSVPASAGSHLVLSAAVRGPLGAFETVRSIAIAAQAPQHRAGIHTAPVVHISEFSVKNSLVHAGDALQLTYATNATGGDVWLIDDAGRLWAKTAITPAGSAQLTVPQAAAGRQLRAVLHATTDKSQATSSVAVMVLPDALQTVAPKVVAAKAGPAKLLVSSDQVAPGDVVTVTLHGTHGDTRVTLTDSGGNTIETGDVPEDQDAVTLSAPNVTVPTTYYVMANISDGVSEQTLVHKLTVSPR